jgi:type II secretory pathway component PulF
MTETHTGQASAFLHAPSKPAVAVSREKGKKQKLMPRNELIRFCRGMASMLKARITASDALRFYAQDHPNEAVKVALLRARSGIEAGVPLYAALAKTGCFDDKLIGLIQAGSNSGQLHRAFASVADRLRKEQMFQNKMKKATLMPAGIIFVLLCLFIVAQVKIVPQVEGLLADVKQEPDDFCKFLFKLSHLTKAVWPFVMTGLVSLVIVLWKATGIRNAILYLLMSRWRLLRQMIMGMRQMLFLGSLHLMHSNGLTLVQCIETAAATVKGSPFFAELLEVAKRYRTLGIPFSEAIKKYSSCDDQVSHMISIGERASSLDVQLELLVTMYEEDTDRMMENLTQVMNLAVLLLASVLIACVFIGAFLPIFLMGPKMMNGSGI